MTSFKIPSLAGSGTAYLIAQIRLADGGSGIHLQILTPETPKEYRNRDYGFSCIIPVINTDLEKLVKLLEKEFQK